LLTYSDHQTYAVLIEIVLFPQRPYDLSPAMVTQTTYLSFKKDSKDQYEAQVLMQKVHIEGKSYLQSQVYGTKDSDDYCVVCMTEKRAISILPCRHLCLCIDCAQTLYLRGNARCPMCRAGMFHVGVESLVQINDTTRSQTIEINRA